MDDLFGVETTEETAEQINQFWAIRAALNMELGDSAEAEICLEEGESNGSKTAMLSRFVALSVSPT